MKKSSERLILLLITCKPRNRVPSSFTMESDIFNKQPVFFSSPWPLPPQFLLHHHTSTTQNFPPIHAIRVPSLFLEKNGFFFLQFLWHWIRANVWCMLWVWCLLHIYTWKVLPPTGFYQSIKGHFLNFVSCLSTSLFKVLRVTLFLRTCFNKQTLGTKVTLKMLHACPSTLKWPKYHYTLPVIITIKLTYFLFHYNSNFNYLIKKVYCMYYKNKTLDFFL